MFQKFVLFRWNVERSAYFNLIVWLLKIFLELKLREEFFFIHLKMVYTATVSFQLGIGKLQLWIWSVVIMWKNGWLAFEIYQTSIALALIENIWSCRINPRDQVSSYFHSIFW